MSGRSTWLGVCPALVVSAMMVASLDGQTPPPPAPPPAGSQGTPATPAQKPAAAPDGQAADQTPKPTFQVQVNLVTTDVIARDDNGPVRRRI